MSSIPKKPVCTAAGYGAILADKQVDAAVKGMLFIHGWAQDDLADGLGEVRLRAIARFSRGLEPPETVGEMKALCAKIARDYAVDCLRKKVTQDRHCVGLCENPDECTPLEYGAPAQRDPVDAGRELEIAADLFRRGEMPEHGVDILEGIACGCSFKEVGEDLGITDRAVEGRLKTMRRMYRQELEDREMTGPEKKMRDP
jgi:DNA-directed RNA polymerase specialized sigma24 family protein